MRFSHFVYSSTVMLSIALLAACQGPQSPGFASSSITNVSTVGSIPIHLNGLADVHLSVEPALAPHPDHRKSWVSPRAGLSPQLLFGVDGDYEAVFIFSLPKLDLIGELTGLNNPQGMCSDKAGNVYVTNTNAFQVLEYSRTGTLLNTYSDPYGYAVGCASDPAGPPGNLAVTNYATPSSSPGNVIVYASPLSISEVLTNPNQGSYYFAGYGPHSTLWVDGTSGDTFILSSCGTESCSTIPISGGKIYSPGAVQWDGVRRTWVVFDQLCDGGLKSQKRACSYPVSTSGVLGRPTFYTASGDKPICDLVQGVIAGPHLNQFVAGDDNEGYCNYMVGTFDRWAYPRGGQPTNVTTLNKHGLPDPRGVAVSTK